MAASVLPDGNFVVSEDGYDPSSYSGVHSLVPILVGLAVPPIVVVYVFPDLLAHLEFFIVLYLMAIFAVSGFMFVRAILNPAHVVAINFDTKQKSAEIVRHSQWGNSSTYVPFKDIADAYIRVRYDDDGYTIREPLLRLRNDDEYDLPAGTDQAEITRIREVLGRR
jgi:hypothetical protein